MLFASRVKYGKSDSIQLFPLSKRVGSALSLEETMAYTGTENLEVMAEAKNYNRYLGSLIRGQIGPNQKVLDFGAGAGTFAIPLSRSGVDVLSIEPDESLRGVLHTAGVPAIASLAEVADGSIDVAYTFNVLEHIWDDAAVIRQLISKLKRGGRLLIYVPAFEVLFSAMDRKVGHHRRYRRRQLIELVESAGFLVRQSAYADSLGFLATLVYRLLGNDTGDINRAALRAYDTWAFPLSRMLDGVFHRWLGKNLMVLAEKP